MPGIFSKNTRKEVDSIIFSFPLIGVACFLFRKRFLSFLRIFHEVLPWSHHTISIQNISESLLFNTLHSSTAKFYSIRMHVSLTVTLSWRRSLPYRNHSDYLQCKSMDWFLFDRDLRLERVNENELHGRRFSGKCPKCPEKLISQTTSDNRVCILFFSQYTTTAEIMLPQYLFYHIQQLDVQNRQ